MNGIMKKMKWFIVATLVILLVGMTLFGVFGFNNSVDHKTSYEVEVSVDQNIEKAKEILKVSTDKYFADNGVSLTAYGYQELDEGSILIYKFNQDVTAKVDNLEDAINAALSAETTTVGVKAEVFSREVIGDNAIQIGWVLLALGVAAVVIFVYTLIMEKLASAVATICSSVLALLLFVAVMSIVRLPAIPFIEILATFAFVFSGILSISTVRGYKEEIKASVSKTTADEIAQKVAKSDAKKYLFALISVFVAAVAITAFFSPYNMIIGGQILISGLVAVASAYFVTPILWTLVKGNKKI